MKSILVTSTESWSGKSILSMALGLALKEKGTPIAYMKPVSSKVSYTTGIPMDRDADAIRSILDLDDSLNDIAPVPLEGAFLSESIASGDLGFLKRVTVAYNRITAKREVALLEGRRFLGLGIAAGLSDSDLAEHLNSNVVILCRYDGEQAIDRVLCALRLLDSELQPLGVIFNEVSMDAEFDLLREEFVPFLAERGTEVLGIVPYDHRLRYVTVEEIVDTLSGNLVVKTSLDRPVGHFLIGAMSPESALRGFRRTPELAVIAGGDRVDIQIAALEAPSLRCLILSGNFRPSKSVLNKAKDKGIPVMTVGQNTIAVAELCEELIGRSRITRGTRLDSAIDLFRTNIDIERLMEKSIDY